MPLNDPLAVVRTRNEHQLLGEMQRTIAIGLLNNFLAR